MTFTPNSSSFNASKRLPCTLALVPNARNTLTKPSSRTNCQHASISSQRTANNVRMTFSMKLSRRSSESLIVIADSPVRSLTVSTQRAQAWLSAPRQFFPDAGSKGAVERAFRFVIASAALGGSDSYCSLLWGQARSSWHGV